MYKVAAVIAICILLAGCGGTNAGSLAKGLPQIPFSLGGDGYSASYNPDTGLDLHLPPPAKPAPAPIVSQLVK